LPSASDQTATPFFVAALQFGRELADHAGVGTFSGLCRDRVKANLSKSLAPKP
jgi:hypothetical protein